MNLEEYPTYEDREKFKKEAWEKISQASSLEEKAYYYLQGVVWAHYWRAREDIESQRNSKSLLRKIRGKKYCPGYQLDIDHYTKHWLHANKRIIHEEVLNVIKEKWGYEPEETKYLPEGCTSYQF